MGQLITGLGILLFSIQVLAQSPSVMDEPVPAQKEYYEIKTQTMRISSRSECRKLISAPYSDEQKSVLSALCADDVTNPYLTLIEVRPLPHRLELNLRQKTFEEELQTISTISSGVMATMFLMPNEITNWNDKTNSTNQRWLENRTSAPVVDSDGWAVNVVGHGYAGASYYLAARHSGRTHWEAFSYSAFMSTFLWEYGHEATIEKPSLQDLITTPVVGSLLGAVLFNLNNAIHDQDGKLLGSKVVGGLGLVLSDPIGSVERGLEAMSHKKMRVDIQMSLGPLPEPEIYENRVTTFRADDSLGLQFKVKFGKRN